VLPPLLEPEARRRHPLLEKRRRRELRRCVVKYVLSQFMKGLFHM